MRDVWRFRAYIGTLLFSAVPASEFAVSLPSSAIYGSKDRVNLFEASVAALANRMARIAWTLL